VRHLAVHAFLIIVHQVEQIMLAPRYKYSVSSLVAMREVSMVQPKINMTKSQAEVVLSTFVARGWLVKSKQVHPAILVGGLV